MRNKKGSHVGIVLSFIIFVTFLVFLYTIVEPRIRTQQNKESFLDYLKIELIKEFSANLTRITVSIINPDSCIKLNDFIKKTKINSNIIVKNAKEEIVSSESSANKKDLLIKNSNDFFKIFYSNNFEELEEETGSCTILEINKNYSITLVKTEEYIFGKKVINLINDYESEGGYENLKKELKIPSGTEFGFSFTYNNGTIIETKEKEIPTKVNVREIPIQYVDEKANILLGSINIKIW